MAEPSEKIRRALHKQTRQTGAVYTTGDEVYYKRSDNNKWKGPAKVIGQDGPVVFIRHGGQFVVFSQQIHISQSKKIKLL